MTFQQWINEQDVVILDGSMSRLLEEQGLEINQRLSTRFTNSILMQVLTSRLPLLIKQRSRVLRMSDIQKNRPLTLSSTVSPWRKRPSKTAKATKPSGLQALSALMVLIYQMVLNIPVLINSRLLI